MKTFPEYRYQSFEYEGVRVGPTMKPINRMKKYASRKRSIAEDKASEGTHLRIQTGPRSAGELTSKFECRDLSTLYETNLCFKSQINL